MEQFSTVFMFAMTLSLLVVRSAGQENQTQTPITSNTNGSCPTTDGLEGRVSQLEQAMLEQQRLIMEQQRLAMELIGARQEESAMVGDCSKISDNGDHSDRVYTLRTIDGHSFDAYCQYDERGSWTVIQRRVDEAVDFQRSWLEYKYGFGNLDSNFWLGNENIYALTNRRQMTLHIELTDWDTSIHYAEYNFFRIDGEDNQYTIHIEGHSGTLPDSITSGNNIQNMPFSTFDRDNDNHAGNCASQFKSGWWHNSCFSANMNGPYTYTNTNNDALGIVWKSYREIWYPFKASVMKVKPTFSN